MSIYRVNLYVSASHYNVEADDEYEAEIIALEIARDEVQVDEIHYIGEEK